MRQHLLSGIVKPVTVAAFAVALLASSPQAAVQGKLPGDAQAIAHALNRISYGARPGEVERVRKMSLAAYIEEQLHPERMPDAVVAERLKAFPTLAMSTADLAREYYLPAEQARRQAQQQQNRNTGQPAQPGRPGRPGQPPPTGQAGQAPPAGQAGQAQTEMMAGAPGAPPRANLPPEVRMLQQQERQVMTDLMQARVVRATESDRQLEEVLVDFWFNHFNVFVGKGQVRLYLPEYERDAIRPHVLGSFRGMLGAVAHSPAMLFYLDNWQSVDPKAGERQMAEQQERQRQQMQRAQRNPQLAARMKDAQDQMQQLQQRRGRGLNENYARELMELHTIGVDAGYTQQDVIEVARVFTGWTIDTPRQGGGFVFNAQMHDRDTKKVLGVEIKGSGQEEGERVLDLLASHPATAKHIATKLARRFVSDEPPASLVDRAAKRFLETKGDLREVTRAIITSPEFFADNARRAKVKTPLEFVVSAVRVSGATVNNAQQLVQALRESLGMPLYGAQPPTGYGDTAADWVNTGALLNRLNFAVSMASGTMRGVRVDVHALAPDTSQASRDRVVDQLLGGRASDATRQTLARAESGAHLVALTLGAPEFQRK